MVSPSTTGLEENAYTQWLKAKGQDWHDLQGEEISPYVKEGPPGGVSPDHLVCRKDDRFYSGKSGKELVFQF
jgi:hypothetical protein